MRVNIYILETHHFSSLAIINSVNKLLLKSVTLFYRCRDSSVSWPPPKLGTQVQILWGFDSSHPMHE